MHNQEDMKMNTKNVLKTTKLVDRCNHHANPIINEVLDMVKKEELRRKQPSVKGRCSHYANVDDGF